MFESIVCSTACLKECFFSIVCLKCMVFSIACMKQYFFQLYFWKYVLFSQFMFESALFFLTVFLKVCVFQLHVWQVCFFQLFIWKYVFFNCMSTIRSPTQGKLTYLQILCFWEKCKIHLMVNIKKIKIRWFDKLKKPQMKIRCYAIYSSWIIL